MANVKYNPNAELRVIVCLLVLGNYKQIQAKKAMLLLNEECFYNSYMQDIYRLIRKQYDNCLPFDEYIILDLTKGWSKSHHNVLDRIIHNEVKTLANFDAYIDELILARQLRKQINAATFMLNCATTSLTNQESAEAFQEGLKEITSIGLNKSKEGKTIAEIGALYFDGYYDNETIKTNIDGFDNELDGGIKNSCLLTICGDTGVGKTYFALYLTYKIGNLNHDKQSLYFNLEMAEQNNWERLIGICAQKPFKHLTNKEKFNAHKIAIQHPITIYEEKHADIDDIITIARVKAIEKPLSVIVVDYISLVECKKDYHRNDLEQTNIAKRLASLAIELNCIVIATSQTNRNPERRGKDDRCPYMTDAAESSGNYKSAEIWIGIDRPEIYDDNPLYANIFIAKLRKNRNGKLFNFAWDFNKGTFSEIDSKSFFAEVKNNSPKNEFVNIFKPKSDSDYLDLQ